LDIEKVLLTFQQLAVCSNDEMNGVIPIVGSAMEYVESVVDGEKVGDENLPQMEYAAACVAFCDYVCREGARDRVTVTATGNADVNADFSSRVAAALELRKGAFKRLENVLADGEFCAFNA
jgi:hypothetical protein